MLDDNFKKSAMEKITTMSANEYKEAFKAIGSLQTNEEWFDDLPTKEKAKAFYEIAKNDFEKLRKQFYGIANDDIDAIAMWLKEEHKDA